MIARHVSRILSLMLSAAILATAALGLPQPASAALLRPLSELDIGDMVDFGGYTWIVVEHDAEHSTTYLVLQGYLDNLAFDSAGSKTFSPTSETNIGYYLNSSDSDDGVDSFYESLPVSCQTLIQPHSWNIETVDSVSRLSDGSRTTVEAKIGLISYSDRGAFSDSIFESLGGLGGRSFFTLTGFTGADAVWFVSPTGEYGGIAPESGDDVVVRPAIYLPSVVTVNGLGSINGTISGPVIADTTLPAGTQGVPYPEKHMSVSGGVPPYLWHAIDLDLTEGLAIDEDTGVISGTPGKTGVFTVVVTVQDRTGASGYEDKLLLSLTIGPPTYALTLSAGAGGHITSGTAASYPAGTVIAIQAKADARHRFAGWSSSNGGTFGDAARASTTFTTPAGVTELTASFIYVEPDDSEEERADAYQADVSGANASAALLPIQVNTGAGTATITADSATGGIFATGPQVIITAPSIPGVSAYTLALPAGSLSETQGERRLTLATSVGSISVPDDMLSSIPGATGKTAGIMIAMGDTSALTEEERAAVGDRPLVQVALTLDGMPTEWSNPDTSVTVSVPYAPTAEELLHPESIIIWYLDGTGKPVCVPNGRFDAATGTVNFDTTHFSCYAVGYNQVGFGDVATDAWYGEAVSYIAARGITTGIGNGGYGPDAEVTRGDLLTMIMRAYGIEPDADPTDNFADAGSTYYTGYLAAAKRLGISTGMGNNTFAPEKETTRQEMFTLLYNTLKATDNLPEGTAGTPLSSFSDAGEIDSWARDAMALLVETGAIGGSCGRLAPTAAATRAEMAQALYNLGTTLR